MGETLLVVIVAPADALGSGKNRALWYRLAPPGVAGQSAGNHHEICTSVERCGGFHV